MTARPSGVRTAIASSLVAIPLAGFARLPLPDAPRPDMAEPAAGRTDPAHAREVAGPKRAKKPVVETDAGSGPGDPSARPNTVSKKDGASG